MKIILAMKKTKENFAENAISYNIAGLNIDKCRLPGKPEPTRFDPRKHEHSGWRMNATGKECAAYAEKQTGRWPSNLILSHMPDCKKDGLLQTKGNLGGYSYKENNYQVEGFVKSCKPKAPSNYGGEILDKWECSPNCPVHDLNENLASRFFKQLI